MAKDNGNFENSLDIEVMRRRLKRLAVEMNRVMKAFGQIGDGDNGKSNTYIGAIETLNDFYRDGPNATSLYKKINNNTLPKMYKRLDALNNALKALDDMTCSQENHS